MTDVNAKIQDEMKDAEAYEAWASETPGWESVLRAIADDERRHARLLEIMREHK